MPRFGFLAALVAGMALVGGGAFWFHATLNEAFARGEAAGRAEILAWSRAEFDRREADAQAALAQSNRDVAALEAGRERLQEQLDVLASTISRSASSGSICLDPDIVRALAAIGRQPAHSGSRP